MKTWLASGAVILALGAVAVWPRLQFRGRSHPVAGQQGGPNRSGGPETGRQSGGEGDSLRARSSDFAFDDEVSRRSYGDCPTWSGGGCDDDNPRPEWKRAGASACEPHRWRTRHGQLRAERQRAVSGAERSERGQADSRLDGAAGLRSGEGRFRQSRLGRSAMRRRDAPRRDVDREVEAVETEWANGVTAKLTRQNYSRRQITPDRSVEGPVMVSELTINGAAVGTAVWFEKDQVFALQPSGPHGRCRGDRRRRIEGQLRRLAVHARYDLAEPSVDRDSSFQDARRETAASSPRTASRRSRNRLARVFRSDSLRERSGVRRLSLARRIYRSAVLRRSRPLLCQERV